MDYYQCQNCGKAIKNSQTPSTAGCPSDTFHRWHKLGPVGTHNYQCQKCGTVVEMDRTPSTAGCPSDVFHRWHSLGGNTSTRVTSSRSSSSSVRGGSSPKLPTGCYLIIMMAAVAWAAGSAIWERITGPVGPHEDGSGDTRQSVQTSREVTEAQNQQLREAKQKLEESIAAAKTKFSDLEKEEIERVQREEEAESKALLALKNAYPRTPDIHRRSYEAGEQLREVSRRYQFQYAAIRDKHEAALRQHVEELEGTYESKVRAINSGTFTLGGEPEVRRAVAASEAAPSLKPFSASAQPAIRDATYFVAGIAANDTLNVRNGPGANYKIVARLPNGENGLRLVGPAVMNGTTEWVPIQFGTQAGWVTKQYLKAE